jgi:hypothetical protein
MERYCLTNAPMAMGPLALGAPDNIQRRSLDVFIVDKFGLGQKLHQGLTNLNARFVVRAINISLLSAFNLKCFK